nr:MAG TPA: hypothetical protein [Caudoviricetes sp.]
MAIDQPLVSYKKAEQKLSEVEHTKDEMDALADRWLAHKKALHGEDWNGKGEQITLSGYLRGVSGVSGIDTER